VNSRPAPSTVTISGRRCALGLINLSAGQGLIEYIGIEEFKAVQIEFNATPGMRFQQKAEIIGQLGIRQVVNLMVEIRIDTPHGTGIGLNRFGMMSLFCNLHYLMLNDPSD
jgi:hypothetical protein